jgi:hypothetical protein
MRTILLTFATIALSVGTVSAQHLTLFEEFTSENCPPCAATNPGLESLCNANPTKTLLIKYEGNAPAATNPNGPYLKQLAQTNLVQTRSSYYALGFNPYARLDGIQWGNGDPQLLGHASFITQARIDSVYALASPFKLEVVSFKFNKTNDSIFATVKITAPAAYAPAGASLVLNAAFCQTLNYSSAADQGIPATYAPASIQTNYPNRINPTGKCGYNGENIFPNVVRQMLPGPGATATPLSATWTANQSQTITLSAKLLSHISIKDYAPFVVVWIQNNTNKRVLTTAKSNGDIFPTNVIQPNSLTDVNIYPNPTNGDVTLNMNLADASSIMVNITDITGNVIYTTSLENLNAGQNQFTIPSSGFPAGMYNVTVRSKSGVANTKLSVVK